MDLAGVLVRLFGVGGAAAATLAASLGAIAVGGAVGLWANLLWRYFSAVDPNDYTALSKALADAWATINQIRIGAGLAPKPMAGYESIAQLKAVARAAFEELSSLLPPPPPAVTTPSYPSLQIALQEVLRLPASIAVDLNTMLQLTGMASNASIMIQQIQVAQDAAKVQAIQQIGNLLRTALSSALAAQIAESRGLTISYLQAQVTTAISNAIAAATPTITVPTFASFEALMSWYSELLYYVRAGTALAGPYEGYWNALGAERIRLTQLVANGTLPIPAIPNLIEYINGDTVRLSTSPIYGWPSAWEEAPPVPVPVPIPEPIPAPVPTPSPTPAPSPGQVINLNFSPTIPLTVSPTIAITTPAPTVLPTPITVVNSPPMITNVVDTSTLAQALPLVGTAVATGILSIAQELGHGLNQGRAKCFASTGEAMLSNILGAAAPLALTLGLDKFGPFRGFLDGLFQKAWNEVLGDPALQSPIPPERAPQVSSALFLKALEAGMTAHLVSAVAESVAPLKQLGLGYLAAFLTDMAGFSKIGGAMMATVESQAIGLPFKYYINEKVRSYIPDVRTLQGLAAEYILISPAQRATLTSSAENLDALDKAEEAEFMRWAAYSGYSDDWNRKFYDSAHRPLSYFALRAVADSGVYDEPLFIGELAHLGFQPNGIRRILDMLKRMSVADTTTLLDTESRYDYLDGFIDIDTYGANLVALGKTPEVTAALRAAAQQRRLRTMNKAKISYMQTAVTKKRMTLSAFSNELVAMGIDTPMIDLYVAQTAVKVNAESSGPARRTLTEGEVARLYQDRKLTYDQAIDRLLEDFTTRDEAVLYLELYPPKPLPEAAVKPIELTPAQIGQLFKSEKLTFDQAVAMLSKRKPAVADPALFLRLYDQDQPEVAAETERELSPAQVGQLFKQQIISGEDALGRLLAQHYPRDEAELLLTLYLPSEGG